MTENNASTRTRITHIAAGDYRALSVHDFARVARTTTVLDRLDVLADIDQAPSSIFDDNALALFDAAALTATARPPLAPALVGVILDHAAGLLTVSHEHSPDDNRAPRIPRPRTGYDEPLPGFGMF